MNSCVTISQLKLLFNHRDSNSAARDGSARLARTMDANPSPEIAAISGDTEPASSSRDAHALDASSTEDSRDSLLPASARSDFVAVPLEDVRTRDARVDAPRYRAHEALDAIGFGRFQVGVLLFVGLAWTADAMEMMLLSFLGPAMRCEFGVSKAAEGALTSVVFAGMMLGAPAWGAVSDRHGRRPALLGSAVATLAAGVGSALGASFSWIIFFRFIVGIGLGGVPVAYGLFMEFLPSGNRGVNLCLIELFWTLGSAIESAMAWIILPHGSWRLLLLLSTTPLFALIVCIILAPESLLYSVSAGRLEEAKETLRRVAQVNGKSLPPGELVVSHGVSTPELEERTRCRRSDSRATAFVLKHTPTSFRELISKKYFRTSALVWLIFFGCAFLYYGVVLITTTLNVRENPTKALRCLSNGSPELSNDEYADIFFSSIAEVPGVLVAVAIVDRVGRKGSMALTLASTAIFMLPVASKALGSALRDIFLFCARSSAMAAFTILYVFAGEIYPTKIRSSGLGVGNAFARVGGITCPLFAVTLIETGHHTFGVLFFVAIACVAVTASSALGVETTGKQLDTDDEPGVELASMTP